MPSPIQKFAKLGGVSPERGTTVTKDPDEAEAPTKEVLVRLLSQHDGNVAQVARATGKHRQQVYRWLKRYGIDAAQYRAEETDDLGGHGDG